MSTILPSRSGNTAVGTVGSVVIPVPRIESIALSDEADSPAILSGTGTMSSVAAASRSSGGLGSGTHDSAAPLGVADGATALRLTWAATAPTMRSRASRIPLSESVKYLWGAPVSPARRMAALRGMEPKKGRSRSLAALSAPPWAKISLAAGELWYDPAVAAVADRLDLGTFVQACRTCRPTSWATGPRRPSA